MMVKRKYRMEHRGAETARRRPGRAGVWLYGAHAARAALANPDRTIRRVLLAGDAEAPPGVTTPAPERVSRDDIAAVLPRGAVHQGIAVLALPLPPAPIEALAAAPADGRAVAVMLDRVTDPQNIGAVLRAAAAFGAAGVVVQDRHAPPETGALAKAASGALETVPLVRVANLARALETLKRAGFWVIGLDQAASAPLAAAAAGRPRTVVVLGAEGTGLRRLVREGCDLVAAIPMAPPARRGAVDSLNVAAAAAIALYVLAGQA